MNYYGKEIDYVSKTLTDFVISGISDTRVLLKILPVDEYMGTKLCVASAYRTHSIGNSQITQLHSYLMQNTYYEEYLALY